MSTLYPPEAVNPESHLADRMNVRVSVGRGKWCWVRWAAKHVWV